MALCMTLSSLVPQIVGIIFVLAAYPHEGEQKCPDNPVRTWILVQLV